MKSFKSNQRKFSNGVTKKSKIKRIIKDVKNEHEIQVRSRGASLIAIPSGYVARQNKTNKVNIVKPINVGNRESEIVVDYLTLGSKSVTSRSTKEFLKSLERSDSEDERLGHKVFKEIDEGAYINQPNENKRKSPTSRDKQFTRTNDGTNRSRFFRNFSSGKANHSFSTSYRPKKSNFHVDHFSSVKPNISKCNKWLRECSKSEIKENERKKFASKMVRKDDPDEQIDRCSQTSDSDELYISESHTACSNSRSSASTRVVSSILKNKGTPKKSTRSFPLKVNSIKCELKSKTFSRKWSNKFQSCSILPSVNLSKEQFRRFDNIYSKYDVNQVSATNYPNVAQERQSTPSSLSNFKKSNVYDNSKNVKPKITGYFETKKRYSSNDVRRNMFLSKPSQFNSDSDGSKRDGYLASIMKKSNSMRKEINTSGSDMSGLLSDEEPSKKLSRIMLDRRRTLQDLEDCKIPNEKKLNRMYFKDNNEMNKMETINEISNDNSFLSCKTHEEQNTNENKDSEKKSFQLEMEEINKKLQLTMSSDVFKNSNYKSQVFEPLEGQNQENKSKSASPRFKSFMPEIPVLSVLTPIPEENPLQNQHQNHGQTSGLCKPEKKFTETKLKNKETKVPAIVNKAIEKRVPSPLKSFETDSLTTNDGRPALLFNKAGFPLTDSKGRCLKNNLGVRMLPANSLKDIIDKKLQVYDAFNYPPTTISFDPTKQAIPAQLNDIRIFDKLFKPRVLYNSLGYPLTDKDGFLLRDNLGNYLVVLDNEGIPMCCANGEPIYMEDGKLWITEKQSYDVHHRNEVSTKNEKRSVTINSEVKSVFYDTNRKATNLGPETSEKVKLDKCTLNYYKSLPNNYVPRSKPKPTIIEEVRKRVARRKERKAEKNRNKTATSSEDTQKSSRKNFKKIPKSKRLSANFKKYLSLKKNFLNITSALPNLNLSEDSTILTDVDDPDKYVKQSKKNKCSPKIESQTEKSDNFINGDDNSTNLWKESNSYVLNLFMKSAENKKDKETFSNSPKKQTYDEKILSATIKDLNKSKLFSQKNAQDVKIDLAYVNRLKRARKDLNNAFDKLVTRKKSNESYESDQENESLDKEWIKLMHANTERTRF